MYHIAAIYIYINIVCNVRRYYTSYTAKKCIAFPPSVVASENGYEGGGVASAEAVASVAGCRRMLSCASTRTDSYYTVTAVVSRLRLQHGLSIAGAPTQSSLYVLGSV